MILEALKNLQGAINRIGLGGTMLALPAPATLNLPDYSSSDNDIHELFLLAIDYHELVSTCRDLFLSGFYQQAAEHAFKVLDDKVKGVSQLEESGTPLMQKAFSVQNPVILLNRNQTSSEKDEQKGYLQLFAGSMIGIRNPITHELDWFEEPQPALDAILICQHLCRKVDAAYSTP